MLHRLIVKVTVFQLPPPKPLSTVVKNILGASIPPPPKQIRLRWSETKNSKFFIIDDFSPASHLMVMKLYSHRTWKQIALTESNIFVNGHCFHDNRLIKLTKKCLKAPFLEHLMKEYDERNVFGHISSLAGNTKIKSAYFSCLDMGTTPFFRLFPLFKI